MSLEDAVAAETSLELDGKRYEFAPLTVRAWGRLIRWAKDEYLSTVMATAARVPDRGLRQELIDRALVFVGRISITTSETDPEAFAAFTAQLDGIDGKRRIVLESLLCTRRREGSSTEITDDFVNDLLEKMNGVNALVDRIVAISTSALRTWSRGKEPAKNQIGTPA